MKDTNTMSNYLNEGFLLEQQKKYEQAIRMFEKAINVSPEHAEGYMCKGGLLLENLKRCEESIECFDKVISLNPSFVNDAYVYKGFALYETGNTEKANDCFLQATRKKIDDKDARGLYHQARAFALLGKPIDAINNLRRAFAMDVEHYRKADALEDPVLKILNIAEEF